MLPLLQVERVELIGEYQFPATHARRGVCAAHRGDSGPAGFGRGQRRRAQAEQQRPHDAAIIPTVLTA